MNKDLFFETLSMLKEKTKVLDELDMQNEHQWQIDGTNYYQLRPADNLTSLDLIPMLIELHDFRLNSKQYKRRRVLIQYLTQTVCWQFGVGYDESVVNDGIRICELIDCILLHDDCDAAYDLVLPFTYDNERKLYNDETADALMRIRCIMSMLTQCNEFASDFRIELNNYFPHEKYLKNLKYQINKIIKKYL